MDKKRQPEEEIESIEHKGVLIHECGIPGEQRKDGVVPAHPNGLQVSEDRWLLLYATRNFRGNDDDCSIIYQLREESPEGRLLKEGMLARSIDDWEPEGFEKNFRIKREHRAPVAFGVPKGAFSKGKPAPNANVFAIKWSTVGRVFDPVKNYVEGSNPDPELVRLTQGVEWMQVKLNEREDDIEVLQPPRKFNQKGYESGHAFCDIEDALWMTQGKTQAIPYDRECLSWVDCVSFNGRRFAALKHVFNPNTGLYEWVETGPFLFDPKGMRVGECALARFRSYWVAATRTDYVANHVRKGRGLAWVKMEDPFSRPGLVSCPSEPRAAAPVSLYHCPDGTLRYFAGEGPSSPYGNERDPLYCWDINPEDNFSASRRRVIFDSVEAGLPIRGESMPKVDMCKLLPHSGKEQYLLHRVSLVSMFHEHVHTKPELWIFPPVNKAEMESCAVYYAKITYKRKFPSPWEFPSLR